MFFCSCCVNPSLCYPDCQKICGFGMKKLLISSLFLFAIVFAQIPASQGEKLTLQNAILAKVHHNTISVIDVMKKMDMLFHRSYPQLIDNKQARYQFYFTQWKYVLDEMIDTELILADAETKGLKITDGEIREQMEERFGPNIIKTLDKVGISYDEAWEMFKTEMVVQRMTGFYVHSKALFSVSPQMVRKAYREYLKENPAEQTWTYQLVTIRSGENPPDEEITSQIHSIVSSHQQDKDTLFESFKEEHPEYDVRISQEYRVDNKQISENHRLILSNLIAGEYSRPIPQESRFENGLVHRIFHLKDYTYDAPASFGETANRLKEELLQRAVEQEYTRYLAKLRKYYGYETLREMVPENFEPFQLQ